MLSSTFSGDTASRLSIHLSHEVTLHHGSYTAPASYLLTVQEEAASFHAAPTTLPLPSPVSMSLFFSDIHTTQNTHRYFKLPFNLCLL